MIDVLPFLRIHFKEVTEEGGLLAELINICSRQTENDGTHLADEISLA